MYIYIYAQLTLVIGNSKLAELPKIRIKTNVTIDITTGPISRDVLEM